MKQLLQITVEIEVERGDDATTTAKAILQDQWDKWPYYNEVPVTLRGAKFLAEHAR